MCADHTTSTEQKRGIARLFAPASVRARPRGVRTPDRRNAFRKTGTRFRRPRCRSRWSPPPRRRAGRWRRQWRSNGGQGLQRGYASAMAAHQGADSAALKPRCARRCRTARRRRTVQDLIVERRLRACAPLATRKRHVLRRRRRSESAGKHCWKTYRESSRSCRNQISISGHTDTSSPTDACYTSGTCRRPRRARGASCRQRRCGDPHLQVEGKATGNRSIRHHDQPANRRIAIVMLRERRAACGSSALTPAKPGTPRDTSQVNVFLWRTRPAAFTANRHEEAAPASIPPTSYEDESISIAQTCLPDGQMERKCSNLAWRRVNLKTSDQFRLRARRRCISRCRLGLRSVRIECAFQIRSAEPVLAKNPGGARASIRAPPANKSSC